jgi:hypothetical protein
MLEGSHGHRIPASRIVTTARTPSASRRDADMIHDFCKNESEKFEGSGRTLPCALKRLAKLVFARWRFHVHQ